MAVKTVTKPAAKRQINAPVATEAKAKGKLFRAIYSPVGKQRTAYTCGILQVLGLTNTRATAKLADTDIFVAFWDTPKAYYHHLSCERFESPKAGKFRLTPRGREYFIKGRMRGENPAQAVSKEMLADAVTLITEGVGVGFFEGVQTRRIEA